ALALLLDQKPEHQVALWSARPENARLLRERRENVVLLPGILIPERVELTEDAERAVDGAALWVSAIPTVFLRETLRRVAPAVRGDPAVLSLSKGIECDTFRRPTEILEEV